MKANREKLQSIIGNGTPESEPEQEPEQEKGKEEEGGGNQ